GQLPASLFESAAAILIGVAGSLHDAIERQEFTYDQLRHGVLLRSSCLIPARCLELLPPDGARSQPPASRGRARSRPLHVYPRPVTCLRRPFDAALARLARIGADPGDDEETRQRKALLVLISVLVLPISVVWGSLYLAFGS